MYHSYVYRITHIESQYHYYGSRFCNMENRHSNIPLYDLQKYQSSSTNKQWKLRIKEYPEEFKFKIIKVFYGDRYIAELQALNHEAKLHQKFDVEKHDRFINRNNEIECDIQKYTSIIFELLDRNGTEVRFSWREINSVMKLYGLSQKHKKQFIEVISGRNWRRQIGGVLFSKDQYEYLCGINTLLDINGNPVNICRIDVDDIMSKYNIDMSNRNILLAVLDVKTKYNQVDNKLFRKEYYEYYCKPTIMLDISGNVVYINRISIDTIMKKYDININKREYLVKYVNGKSNIQQVDGKLFSVASYEYWCKYHILFDVNGTVIKYNRLNTVNILLQYGIYNNINKQKLLDMLLHYDKHKSIDGILFNYNPTI